MELRKSGSAVWSPASDWRRGSTVRWLLLSVGLGWISLFDSTLWSQTKEVVLPRGTDVSVMKKDILLFEKILDVKLSHIPNAMLAVVDRTKGVYLKGYGIVLTFLVNINRVVITTPFGERPVGKRQTAEEKRRRIHEIREMLIQALKDNPGSFKQLTPSDAVVIVAHFEDSNELDDAKRHKTIVLKVFKRDLDVYKTNGYEKFKQQVVIDEY
ncbi:MAG: hypothetical protein HYR55_13555 [Acidobacteria bacterium]|nr:hypothetical protein [Acidobacteriota bacterium]MBI3658151.1 hypothetical protein [Acidobacteriota bacterium]